MRMKRIFGWRLNTIMVPLYPANLVEFLAHFLHDAHLFCEVEQRVGHTAPLDGEKLEFIKKALEEGQGEKLNQYEEKDLPKDGFKEYLHWIILGGVAHPYVLQIVRKNFSNFSTVDTICKRIESIMEEYSPSIFKELERQMAEHPRLRETNVDYLKRYYFRN